MGKFLMDATRWQAAHPEMEGWYADGLQAATVSELKTILFDRRANDAEVRSP